MKIGFSRFAAALAACSLPFSSLAHAALDLPSAPQQFNASDYQSKADALLTKYQRALETVPDNLRLYGSPDARFLIREFSDVECPWCRSCHPEVIKAADALPDEIAVEWVHMAGPFHDPAGTDEAAALECVYSLKDNRTFWAALDLLFESTAGNGKGSPLTNKLPVIFDLDPQSFQECRSSPALHSSLKEIFDQAYDAGVTATPALLIADRLKNRMKLFTGARKAEDILKIIQEFKEQE